MNRAVVAQHLHSPGSANSGEAIVYIVEDDRATRDALSLLCKGLGVEAVLFDGGIEFLAHSPEAQSGCVLIEMNLHDINGIHLMKQLQESGVILPMILLSSDTDVATAVKAMRNGAYDYIEKPFLSKTLSKRIKQAIDDSVQRRLIY